MKNYFSILLLIAFTINCFGQDTLTYKSTRSQFFGLSPLPKKIDSVNGLVLGLGHVENRNIENQTINGLNIEANPAPVVGAFYVFLYAMYLPEIIQKNKKYKSNSEHNFIIKTENNTLNLKINGFNLSTGCFFTTTNMNGLNISLGNKFKNFNGLTMAPLGTISDKLNGMSIGIVNTNTDLKGGVFGLYNQTYELKGFQFGIVNQVEKSKGIQLGVFNKSYSRGIQLGVWNKNSNHSFPIINW